MKYAGHQMFCWVCDLPITTYVLFSKHYLDERMIYFCSEAHKSLHEGLKDL